MNTKTTTALISSAALLLALTGCSGSAAAQDACIAEAAMIAADHEGQDAADFTGDYELMALCDNLLERFDGDEGRIVYAVQCIGERAEMSLDPDSLFVWPDDHTFPEVMNDPMTTLGCV